MQREINSNYLLHNLEIIKKETNKTIIGVVKSDAYGNGIKKVCDILQNHISIVAVVNLKEAIEISSYPFDILILNSLTKDEISYLNNIPNIIFSINSFTDLINIKSKRKVHFQIDSGMNRQGFKNLSSFKNALDYAISNPNITIDGIYTHFTDDDNVIPQCTIFKKYLSLFNFPLVHTGSRCNYQKIPIGNSLRVGLDLYGDGSKKNIKQIFTIYCYPLEIKSGSKKETIGYNRNYVFKDNNKVAILPIGYANGFIRELNGTYIKANNKLYPVIGNVCMNHIFVLVDNNITIDTKFIITDSTYPIINHANYLKTISYELMVLLK